METRQILQIVLAVIFLSIIGLGVFIFFSIGAPADRVVVKEVITEAEQKEEANPWEFQGEAATKLVQTRSVMVPPPENKDDKKRKKSDDAEPTKSTVGKVLEDDAFIKDILKLGKYKKLGWNVQWWGETKHGEWFYLVSYQFEDANIKVGPTWLVDLKAAKVVPKNALARVVMQPSRRADDTYFDKEQQVVSALASHRFESGLTLGGALLMHFETREESAEGDTIIGWTIEHDRGSLFKAFFQFVEAGEPTYAEFEFDYDAKALKASNLQAADVMRIGEDFTKTERADIMPESYDPKAKASKRWTGKAKKACASRKLRDQCKSMATVFEQRQIVEALEWMLTAQAENAEAFRACKDDRKCRWSSKPKTEAKTEYIVQYLYDLDGKKEKAVAFEIALKDSSIKPLDKISQAAYSAINVR